jgi:hypothetical protein
VFQRARSTYQKNRMVKTSVPSGSINLTEEQKDKIKTSVPSGSINLTEEQKDKTSVLSGSTNLPEEQLCLLKPVFHKACSTYQENRKV